RGYLPFSFQSVGSNKIYLRPVKGGFTLGREIIQLILLSQLLQHSLSLIPQLPVAEVVIAAVAETQAEFKPHAQVLIHILGGLHEFGSYLLDLILSYESVTVVLGKGANTGKTVEFAGFLIPVVNRVFHVLQRQLPVGSRR